ncbi:MAG: hypothetical protein JWO31_3003 [Phycisphaerales bacterium]|nr:hypothetical protein [Phycisphaerales bacterium]
MSDDPQRLGKLRAAWRGTQELATTFEELMGTTSDPAARAVLVRQLSEADRIMAEIGHSISQVTGMEPEPD